MAPPLRSLRSLRVTACEGSRRHPLAPQPETGQIATSIYYTLPIQPSEEPRTVAVWTASTLEPGPWRFVDAEDANATPLPSEYVELRLEPGAHPTLTLAVDLELDGEPWRGWWPPLLEMPPRLRPLLDNAAQLARSSPPQ